MYIQWLISYSFFKICPVNKEMFFFQVYRQMTHTWTCTCKQKHYSFPANLFLPSKIRLLRSCSVNATNYWDFFSLVQIVVTWLHDCMQQKKGEIHHISQMIRKSNLIRPTQNQYVQVNWSFVWLLVQMALVEQWAIHL